MPGERGTLAARRRWVELDEAIAAASVASAGSDTDLRDAIDELLKELPQKYRAAIVLCYRQGLTHEEAAARLRCPVGTVRSRLARGRTILKERLHRAGLAPPAVLAQTAEPFDRQATPALVAPRLVESIARTPCTSPVASRSRIVPTRIAELVMGASQTMTVSKLAVASSLLVFTGLIAWGAAGGRSDTNQSGRRVAAGRRRHLRAGRFARVAQYGRVVRRSSRIPAQVGGRRRG